ncbi:MAG: site-2 protease family protein [Nitrospirae bacterium]|nr:site-2 protease family protein [Nitrospirota bacterium]
MLEPNILSKLAVSVVPLLIAIVFHEVSHGFVANRLGDPTAKFTGRLTLNPLAHIDPMGTVILPLMLLALDLPVFGYAKPVPINPMNFKNPRKGMAISAAAGPVTNILLAIFSILFFKIIFMSSAVVLPGAINAPILQPLTLMMIYSIRINVFLAALNLIPIPPLDGGRVFVGILPHKQAVSYSKIEPYGIFIVYGLLFTGIAGYFVFPLEKLILSLVQLF